MRCVDSAKSSFSGSTDTLVWDYIMKTKKDVLDQVVITRGYVNAKVIKFFKAL